MSTRSITGFIHNNQIFGSYNHLDGYPTGVGIRLQKEVKDLSWDQIRNGFKILKWVDPEEHYHRLRGDQGSLARRLARGEATDDRDFVKDSLFCEYAYLFNLDEATVEILEGFNKSEESQHHLCVTEPDGQGYYGCSVLWVGTLEEFRQLNMGGLE